MGVSVWGIWHGAMKCGMWMWLGEERAKEQRAKRKEERGAKEQGRAMPRPSSPPIFFSSPVLLFSSLTSSVSTSLDVMVSGISRLVSADPPSLVGFVIPCVRPVPPIGEHPIDGLVEGIISNPSMDDDAMRVSCSDQLDAGRSTLPYPTASPPDNNGMPTARLAVRRRFRHSRPACTGWGFQAPTTQRRPAPGDQADPPPMRDGAVVIGHDPRSPIFS